ncbi:MAG: BspA family leucine-rich repeat surface protein [Bacilli bacterium]|nr:BspA family leucine-rich repeat surface protein [Bacilli bacterium]
MKKIVLAILMFFMFMPFIYGESCDANKITIDSITIDEMNGSVFEKNNASVEGNNINLDLSMSNVGDSITYKIIVKNDSDEIFEITESSLSNKSNYIRYSLNNGNSVVVKAKSTKTIYLIAEYENEVPASLIQNDVYTEKEDLSLGLSTLTNPKTGDRTIIIISIVLVLSIIVFLILRKKKNINMLDVFIILILIPVITHATCKVDIMIESNVEIKKIAEFDVGSTVKSKMTDMIASNEPAEPNMPILNSSIGVVTNGSNNKQITSFKRSEMLPQEVKTLVDDQIVEYNNFIISENEINQTLNDMLEYIKTIEDLTISEENGIKIVCLNFEGEEFCISESDIGDKDNDIIRFKNENNEYSYLYVDGKAKKFIIITEDGLREKIIEELRLERRDEFLKNVFSSANSDYLIYGWYDENDESIYYYCEKEDIYLNSDSSHMFEGIGTLESAPGLTNLNASRVNDMTRMFSSAGSRANSFTLNNIAGWDVSNVQYMFGMFENAGHTASNVTIDLSNWDVSKVYNMGYMFYGVGSTASSINLSLTNWKTSNVNNMSYMFYNYGQYISSFSLDLSSFDTSNVNNMDHMFSGAGEKSSEFTLNLTNWNTSNVTNMNSMFADIANNAHVINLDLSRFNTSNVTNMEYMFSGYGKRLSNCTLDISNFDTSKVTNMAGMFEYMCYNTTNIDFSLPILNTSNVINMSGMFANFGGNSSSVSIDLSNLNTSNVQYMARMFREAGINAQTFNLNLSSFDTSNVTTMEQMFSKSGISATTWNIGNLSNWNTSNVRSMRYMFNMAGEHSTEWNIGDLSNWDTSKVTNIDGMFYKAGTYSTTWNSIGTLKIYSNNINYIFKDCWSAKANLKLYNSISEYDEAFNYAAGVGDSRIVVDYTSDVTNIDDIIGTKSSNSNVTKGELIN